MISGIGRYKREISVAAAYLLLLLALALVRIPGRPSFFAAQFRDTWINSAPMLVAAVGMTLVILSIVVATVLFAAYGPYILQ